MRNSFADVLSCVYYAASVLYILFSVIVFFIE